MKTRLEARNEHEILTMKELFAQKDTILEAIKKFDGKVVNIKLNKAVNELLPASIRLGGDDFCWINNRKYTGLKLTHSNRWWSTGIKNSGGCDNGGYIYMNETTIPLVMDGNGRLMFDETHAAIELALAVLEGNIAEREGAMLLIKEERECAQSIKNAIREYNTRFHHSIRMTNFNDANITV